jgi:hypothetical protein
VCIWIYAENQTTDNCTTRVWIRGTTCNQKTQSALEQIVSNWPVKVEIANSVHESITKSLHIGPTYGVFGMNTHLATIWEETCELMVEVDIGN